MSLKSTTNKKKIVIMVLAFIFCIISTASAVIFPVTAHYNGEIKEMQSRWNKVRVADSSLYSDNGYIDYANEVFLDDETHPDLKEMGLYWAKWDDQTERIKLTDADTEEGAKLVDTKKPTIFFVHGMLLNGHLIQEQFYLSSLSTNTAEFDVTTQSVSLIHLWLLEGWNVGVFHYNRFAAEVAPTPIEAKVWATDGPEGMRIRHADNSVTQVTEYTISEHFVAEYLRAMNLLPDTMGEQEIRIAAHSMGGEVMTASVFLLTEVAAHGQLDYDKLPNRYTMLDPYFSVNLQIGDKIAYIGPKDITIRWSGKGLYKNNTAYTIIECLKDLSANGIAIDYYTHRESTLMVGMPKDITDELKSLCTYVMLDPNYASYGQGYSVVTNGHNGIRDWYYCSIRGDLVKYEGSNPIFNIAASAKTPTSVILAQKGMAFRIIEGNNTVYASDDVFTDLED